jgi:hypothetical protein
VLGVNDNNKIKFFITLFFKCFTKTIFFNRRRWIYFGMIGKPKYSTYRTISR